MEPLCPFIFLTAFLGLCPARQGPSCSVTQVSEMEARIGWQAWDLAGSGFPNYRF